MNRDLDHPLRELDRALLRLLAERARLEATRGAPLTIDADDLLARHPGPLGAGAVAALGAAIAAARADLEARP